MRRERICPLCGGNIERRDGTAHSDTAYGKRLSLYLSCDDPACGFGLAFPFDAEVYIARACEEIRTRTRTLPADARAEALLASLSYCRRDTDDPLSEKLSERVNVIFMEALGEILKRARDMLRDLSYREPNVKEKTELRRKLRTFLRFLDRMEEHYPTERLKNEFYALRDGLSNIDYHYELGMLAREEALAAGSTESASDAAEQYFLEGVRRGGIRSRLAYAKYILAEQAETEEEREAVKAAYAAVAPVSQEACYEYATAAEIGIDDVPTVLDSYRKMTYASLSSSGKLAFLRLELSLCVERYEPTLAALQAMPVRSDGEGDDRAERVLSEFEALVSDISDACDALIGSVDAIGGHAAYSGDLAAVRTAADEENTVAEYLIGCAMYYRSMTDAEKRFDISYLREAIGHFSAFLSSELMKEDRETQFDLPSVIGFRNLRGLMENARRYRHALAESIGAEGEGV